MSSLIEQARQGDIKAIASVIQQALRDHEILVTANLHHSCLQLALESSRELDAAAIVPVVERIMGQLNVTAIESVKLYALVFGNQQPVWMQELELHPQSPEEILDALARSRPDLNLPRPKYARPQRLNVSSRSARFKPPAKGRSPLGQQDLAVVIWERWLKPLEPLKLSLLIMLTIHTVFGASSYSIQGFMTGTDPVMMFLHNVNLIFHEAGHVLFSPFGRFLYILGGSLFQILVPLGISVYFVVTQQCYAGAIAFWWVGQNFLDVSVYIRDARERALPLLIDLPEAHDWHNLLLSLRLLIYDDVIANLCFAIGLLICVGAIAAGLYWARRMEEEA
jgi:hypothetical protein